MKRSHKPKVYLVGAGPGDPALTTVKARQLVAAADIILYDRLIPMQLLQLAKPGAELISVGKRTGNHTMKQDEINALLIEKASGEGMIVRLKGGDPYMFGRGGEEALALVGEGISFEVVPGITSPLAASAFAGIPPTHRGFAANVAIVTGHRRNEERIKIPNADTLIFLMSVANIDLIIADLLEAGWGEDTPIAAIENGTHYNQRTVTGTLADFGKKLKGENIHPPTIFIVGQVVTLSEKLDWFGQKPRILVLGMHPEKYTWLGTIVHRQIIDCLPIENNPDLDNLLQQLSTFDWIAFTSANGVRYFFERLNALGLDARCLAGVKIATIGQTTASRLGAYGLIADMVAADESSAGMLKEFGKLGMGGKKVLLPQSEIASAELPDGLTKAGAEVTKIPVYKTVEIDPDDVDFDHIDAVLFTSGSTVRAFMAKFGAAPAGLKAYCLGKPTQNEAKKHGIDAEIVKA